MPERAWHAQAVGSSDQGKQWSAVILAGGKGSRIGGHDKADMTLGGVSALDWILEALPDEAEIVVVAPDRHTARPAVFCLEEPRFGGPVAALAAALVHVTSPVIAILGGDMPRSSHLAMRLVEEFRHSNGAALIPVDADGRRQPLGMVVDAAHLREAITAIQPVEGRAMHEVISNLVFVERPLSEEEWQWLRDFDTAADLQALRATTAVASSTSAIPHSEVMDGVQMSLDRWVQELRAELGIEDDIDIDAILDLARVAAHGVQRPAAPLTAYMLGLAVARGQDFTLASRAIELSANSWVKSASDE